MRTVWRVLVRTVFWSYERGTWPYDVAVVGIVLFVLLTPRSWFNDQSQVGLAPSGEQVKLLNMDPGSGAKTYRVDARLLASSIRTPQLDHDIHDAVRKSVSEWSGGRFQIVRIDPVRGEDGTVISYDVTIKP